MPRGVPRANNGYAISRRKGERLSEIERETIRVMHGVQERSVSALSRMFGRNRKTIQACLRKNRAASPKKQRRRSPKAAEIQKRRAFLAKLRAESRFDKDKDGNKIVVGKRYPSVASLRVALKERHKIDVRDSTVGRDLAAIGAKSRVRPKTGCRAEATRIKRLEFARLSARLDARTVVFSDECWCNDNDYSCRTEWVLEGETPTPRVHMKRAKIRVMIWGAVGYNFKAPLVFLEGSVTKQVYLKECIDPNLRRLKANGRVFMQDNAPAHTASRAYLEGKGVKLLAWPPHSPHLNPIEKVWALVHKEVSALRPKTKAELISAVQKVWRDFKQATINGLVDEWANNMQKTIRLKGEAF